MKPARAALALGCLAMVAGCGGGAPRPPAPTPTAPSPSPTATPTPGPCTYTAQARFVRDTLNEWYLFPELLDLSVQPGSFTTLQAYVDALVAPARAQSRDRFFTYVTSIREENEFFFGGSSAGFGFRLAYDGGGGRVFVSETYEGTAAFGANLDRGTELLAIGTGPASLVSVASLMASGGAGAVQQALGPPDAGVARVLRVRDQAGVEREVALTKTEYALDPVSDRYGARIIEDGGRRVGYLNLRTFIDPAIDDLVAAFATFRAQGITDFIIDLRYNGGGGVNVAEALGDLLARNLDGQVYYQLLLRPSKAGEGDIYRFSARPQSVAPTRIAFIGTSSTASASELIINGMKPHLGADNIALVGQNTSGKPVGQFAFDLPDCDLRLRAVTFRLVNANGEGDYFNGLASTLPRTCRAVDDLAFPLGDPREAMVATALDFLAGRSCTPIGAGITAQRMAPAGPVTADRPRSVAEREVPGIN